MSANTTGIRVSKTNNEKAKAFAREMDISAADFADRAFESIFAMLEGDDRTPLLVAEYRLKKSYQSKQPAAPTKKKGK